MSFAQALEIYRTAKECVQGSQFSAELLWQASRNINQFNESELLRESAWVILCSGFKESVIRRRFPFISTCFCNWESSEAICASAQLCRITALSCFGNERKIQGILDAATYIHGMGFEYYKQQIIEDPLPALSNLPFIGAITANHLAKNLGFELAKADRHLQRFALSVGFGHPQELCVRISDVTGDPVRVVDLILWRYLEQRRARERSSPIPDS
jgi:hypothetical protein